MESKEKKDDNNFNDVYATSNENMSLVSHYWKRFAIILFMFLGMILGYMAYNYSADANVPVPVVKFHLIKFIKNIRGQCSDPVVIRQRVKDAYSFTTSKSKRQLDKIINDIELIKKLHDKKTVLITITNINQKLKSLYTVTWIETEYQNNKVLSVLTFEGFFRLEYLSVEPFEKNNNYSQVNPSSIFINNIVINKISKPKLNF